MTKSVNDKLEKQLQDLICTMQASGLSDTELGKVLSDTIMKEHRTHQQDIMRILRETITLYGRYATVDDRNEAARQWANEVSTLKILLPRI